VLDGGEARWIDEHCGVPQLPFQLPSA
jgi:hypothetical protein